jgi:hypothetical protein
VASVARTFEGFIVSASLTRAGLFVLVAAAAASAGGQPPAATTDDKPKDPRPAYTAFPDLKPPTVERVEAKEFDGRRTLELVEKDAVPLPPWPAAAADAPQLRRLQVEQLQEGRAYIDRMIRVTRVGRYTPEDVRELAAVTAETYRLAAELEEKPAARVPWYEARVRKLKEYEQTVEQRVATGTSGPQEVNLARMRRLQAEIDLTKVKAAAGK